ncbi:carbamoyl-phosphate synthase large subunit [Clostridiisalibacter paucivorans]|uniref:carbamoyl-phosphate synthase large subunit n=1 Tax=Clostridiisalibacter paucivorans TaxID=408753 RepID=UPI00047997E4|nr:carbamoyl-phosphate synthase large subunit [Clostridiisalibacter paucivorans]
MAKDKDIKKVLVIGSGPIVIGQGAEFDYSGTQAVRALKEEGIEVVLVNSNPATIMTDKIIADKVYIEPLTVAFIEKIILKERPDALLATMGGQTSLNMAVKLYDADVLDRYGVKVIGTSIESIKKGEDRELFRQLMKDIGEPIIDSKTISTLEEGVEFSKKIGFPIIVRPAYTLGGEGGGIAEDLEELKEILQLGLSLSPVSQVLLEKSIKGYKEVEYEVMRDGKGNCISVCNMENIDPVGIHTGDSIVVAPSQTLSDKEYQMLRSAAFNIVDAIDLKGGCNVQFALNPESMEYAVIEINPRVSRSSALASKATGYPIAKVAAKISLGYTLDEIINPVTEKTYACFEPSLDYVVVKIPKWPFDKFKNIYKHLGTKMMATGEVMAIGANFEQAFLKAIRSLEIGQYSLDFKQSMGKGLKELKENIITPDDDRIFYVAQMLRENYRVEMISKITGIDLYFLNKLKGIVQWEEQLKNMSIKDLNKDVLLTLKRLGFSDKGISELLDVDLDTILNLRENYNIIPSYKMVDTCAGEFEAVSPYYYSTYEQYDEVIPSENKKVLIVGSGPIRIGQGIEFDYCSVQSVMAMKEMGIETIVVNNNPETVSTDFDISDRLYFEPLTEEDVYNVILKERPDGVILQFGGQTAIKLVKFLDKKGIKILGTQKKGIDQAEDREKFDNVLEKLNIVRPKGKGIFTKEQGLKFANKIGYPLLVRPSYVLGGSRMEIIDEEAGLIRYLDENIVQKLDNPILIDKYIKGIELEVDAIYDGKDVLIPGIMRHLERAGVHSGDSMTMYPAYGVSEDIKRKILMYTENLAKELEVIGVINIQFIADNDILYVIEVNPRSSRTIPYISKVTGVNIVKVATMVTLGKKLKSMGYDTGIYREADYISVKGPVFSTRKLPGLEVSLGPEMRSTGEVLGIGKNIEEALYKTFIAAGFNLQFKNKAIIATIGDRHKLEFVNMAKKISELGFKIYSTVGTYKILKKNNIDAEVIGKIDDKGKNILDIIKNKEIDFVVNTPTKGNQSKRDGFKIRRKALENSIDVFTSLDTVNALLNIVEDKEEEMKVYSLQEM